MSEVIYISKSEFMPEILNTSNCKDCAFRSLLFENVTDGELDQLDRNKVEKIFLKGESIVFEGEEVHEFLYLKDGLVKLTKSDISSKEHIICLCKPLNFIGFLSVFSNPLYQYSIHAIEDSTVCFINMDTIRETIRTNGEFGLEVLEKVSSISDSIIQKRVMIASKQMRGRIAFILVYFAKEIYLNSRFILPLSRKEIAQIIDLSTENVIRMLSEFRKDGILKIDGNDIEILDFPKLEWLTKFG